jgi:D-sedoheptulose 7-phosphate isomerase
VTSDAALAAVRGHVEDHAAVTTRLLADDGRLAAVAAVAAAVTAALRAGQKLLLFGNGGSAADAQHLAAEFVGRYRRERNALPALALSTNTSALTAIGNDYAFADIFARQVEGLGQRGDVAIGLTTSGTSPNVLRALEAAKRNGLVTVAFTGGADTPMTELVDHCIQAPTTDTPRVQEVHILLGHVVCELVEPELFP